MHSEPDLCIFHTHKAHAIINHKHGNIYIDIIINIECANTRKEDH